MNDAGDAGRDDETVRRTNEVREHVVRTLKEHLELSARMREFERTFDAQVLHTARQLHELIAEGNRLQEEYGRIKVKAARGGYASPDELERDVHAVLTAVDDEPEPIEATAPPVPGGEDLDGATMRRILREFRRVVLPNVHADTSDAAFPEFEAALSAYESKDYVLMEAFVIRHRGPVGPSDDDGRPLAPDESRTRLGRYDDAARRLDRRHRALRREVTDAELHDSAEARERIERQAEQFRRAIYDEAARVRRLRLDLETLTEGDPT
jgi:hypothetical protein